MVSRTSVVRTVWMNVHNDMSVSSTCSQFLNYSKSASLSCLLILDTDIRKLVQTLPMVYRRLISGNRSERMPQNTYTLCYQVRILV